jgi:hypothetical protein
LRDLKTNQTSPRKAPMVLLESSLSNHKKVHTGLENHLLQTFHQTPSVQTIFMSVNRFNLPTPILSSSILSMACVLPFLPLPPGHLRSSGTCSNPVSDPNQITDHLTIIICTFAHTSRIQNKLFRDHSLTYSSSF